MDPNEVLAAIRRLTSDEADWTLDDPVDVAVELAELVDSLDKWLTHGGFLPADWTTPSRS